VRSTSGPDRYTPRETASGTQWTSGPVGPSDSLEVSEKIKFSYPFRKRTKIHWSSNPQGSHCSEYTNRLDNKLVLQIHRSCIIATNAGTVLTQDNINWQSIPFHAQLTTVLRYLQLFALINCRSFHRTCDSDSGRAVDSRRNNVWNGRPEHAITRGDVESTNQNRIRLSTAVSVLSFMEEWGGKRFIKQETAK